MRRKSLPIATVLLVAALGRFPPRRFFIRGSTSPSVVFGEAGRPRQAIGRTLRGALFPALTFLALFLRFLAGTLVRGPLLLSALAAAGVKSPRRFARVYIGGDRRGAAANEGGKRRQLATRRRVGETKSEQRVPPREIVVRAPSRDTTIGRSYGSLVRDAAPRRKIATRHGNGRTRLRKGVSRRAQISRTRGADRPIVPMYRPSAMVVVRRRAFVRSRFSRLISGEEVDATVLGFCRDAIFDLGFAAAAAAATVFRSTRIRSFRYGMGYLRNAIAAIGSVDGISL